MKIDEDLAAVAAFTEADQFADVRRHVDPEWVRDALEATGTATVRRRRLPAEQVVWLVIGMAMFRKWPIHDLVGRLNLLLPGRTRTVVPSTVAEAREKVGAEPLERLFDMCARKWAHASAVGTRGEVSRCTASIALLCGSRTRNQTVTTSAARKDEAVKVDNSMLRLAT